MQLYKKAVEYNDPTSLMNLGALILIILKNLGSQRFI